VPSYKDSITTLIVYLSTYYLPSTRQTVDTSLYVCILCLLYTSSYPQRLFAYARCV